MRRRGLVIALFLVVLSGCGFHLRGSEPLPALLARPYLALPPSSPLYYELQSQLRSAGAQLAQTAVAASAQLIVDRSAIRSRTLGLDSQGRATEYGLTLHVTYHLASVHGEAITGELPSRVERELRFDPDDVLAQEAEREQVTQQMYRLAAQQMLRRLRHEVAASDAAGGR